VCGGKIPRERGEIRIRLRIPKIYCDLITLVYYLSISICVQRDVLKRYLLSRILKLVSGYALRLLKIIEPYLVEQERMANAQLLRYGSKHLGQNFFFHLFV
jgi:hypothetical protein